MGKKKKARSATTASTTGGECERNCAEQANACRERARAEYERMLEDCRNSGDPSLCMERAARAYSAMLNACQSDYNLCLSICRGGTGGGGTHQ